MLPSIVDAYSAQGFVFELGSPSALFTGLTPRSDWQPRRRFDTLSYRQVGISIRDAWFFMLVADALKQVNNHNPSLVIGNSHGISTTLIAELLKPSPVDAIDAETSMGSDQGTPLTRRVAKHLNLDVQITTGFSPQDLNSACRFDKYALVFVDGEHTNHQIVEDFIGIADRLADNCVVFFHDVGLRDMDSGWARVKELAQPLGLIGYDLPATDSGSTLLVRNVPSLERMLKQSCVPLRAHNDIFHAGLSLPLPTQSPDTDILVVQDNQRIAFLGAGNDLAHYAHFILSHPDRVDAIYDDDQTKVGTTRFGFTIQPTANLANASPDAIVISTHKYVDQMRLRAIQLAPKLIAHTYPRTGLLMPTRLVCVPSVS